MPKVTVLVAIRNREKLIRGCLDCLVSQTIIKNAEIIVINGNSTENEKDIILKYQKICPSIRYIFTKKLGLYHAWNLGIKASKGKYITNLNADDRLKKNALEVMARALDQNPKVGLVYADSYVTLKPNETFEKNSSRGKHFNWPEYSHKELLMYCFCGPHPMWRKKLHRELGYFKEDYKIAGDYDFWLRIAEKYQIKRIRNIIGLYYLNLKGLCYSNHKLLCKEIIKVKSDYLART